MNTSGASSTHANSSQTGRRGGGLLAAPSLVMLLPLLELTNPNPATQPTQSARSPVSQCTRCTVRGSGTTISTPVAVWVAGYSASRRRYRVSCGGKQRGRT
jgi:hypothetical protein